MKEKGFAQILFLVGILILVGGGVYYLGTLRSQPQSASQTQNTQTQGDTAVIPIQSPVLVTRVPSISNPKNTPSPQILPTNTPSINTHTYLVPKIWTRVTTSDGLTLCLPPKWETDQWGNVYFNRDPAYKPNVTYIQEIPYISGSRREAYYKFWETEYPDVRELVSIRETNIGNNTVLTIFPTIDPSVKSVPDGHLAVIWFANGKLWKAGLSGWNMVNDSQAVFLKDFYTMISCS